MENRSKNKRGGQGGFSLLELILAMGIAIIISAMALPKVMTMIQNLRTSGDASSLNSAILLAKMSAASDFARARVYVDLSANTFHVEVYTSGDTQWRTPGGTQSLSKNVTFGYGSLTSAPSGVASLTQAPACLEKDMLASNTYPNTACIMFNSRGIPVDNSMVATPNDAIYVTDGQSVTGVTVSATGLTKVWRTDASGANWIQR